MRRDGQPAAIVTGASRGIGSAIARRLAEQGFAVIVNFNTGGSEAACLVDDVEAAGGTAHAVQADVSNGVAFARLFDAAEDLFGGVSVLVNNAGIMAPRQIAEVEDDWFDHLFAINVKGVLNGCRLAAARLRDGGCIVNLSSSVLGLSPPNYGPYCASKAAVEALTRSLAKEVGARGIRANVVAPGPTDTDLLTQANSAERLQGYRDATPLGRLGNVVDVAGVVAFLASPAAAWINGQTLRVNGGMIV